ncbi:predicted protein [Sclerotinia sclerotiorum 1980 UF-70]|uniref:Uncharacterized protein n=1 Tax=Sclerotinia sclerotiorum (strain ATCC 18683 / 1980 / Ss-1) TaxID=665079 RepID=A7EY52_SCLS1|nr:predicted protein [Sclerotinia sclerotiorum 1980 UF-70]EDN94394.1 predicted protein [Sclerotinia sclerotiorum 1980 UF-70]
MMDGVRTRPSKNTIDQGCAEVKVKCKSRRGTTDLQGNRVTGEGVPKIVKEYDQLSHQLRELSEAALESFYNRSKRGYRQSIWCEA